MTITITDGGRDRLVVEKLDDLTPAASQQQNQLQNEFRQSSVHTFSPGIPFPINSLRNHNLQAKKMGLLNLQNVGLVTYKRDSEFIVMVI